MKKLLTLAMVLAFAMVTGQAFAEQSVSGYFRVQAFTGTSGIAKDATENNIIDQRLRVKYTNKLSDDTSVVWFGEVDTPWGQSSKGAIGGGGAEGADGVNIETKNVYATFKVADTKLTAGIQGFMDSYDGLVYANDIAGLRADMKVAGADATLFYGKGKENTLDIKDDADMFAAVYKRDALTVSLYDFATQNGDAGDRTDELMLGAKFNYGAGDVYGLYNFGKNSAGTDVAAYAAGASFKADGVGTFNALYVSAADDATDDGKMYNNNGGFGLYTWGLSIFTYDVYYNNAPAQALAKKSIDGGNGLIALNFNNKMDLDGGMYLKYAAGYFMAADDAPKGGGALAGTNLGAEVAAQIGKKFDKADLSIRGAYAMLGDAYDGSSAGQDPDDVMQVVAMLNIGF